MSPRRSSLVVKKQNLVLPMLTGRKQLPPGHAPLVIASTGLAVAILAVAGGAVYLILRLGA